MKRNFLIILPAVLCAAIAVGLGSASSSAAGIENFPAVPNPTPTPNYIPPPPPPAEKVDEVIRIETELVNLNVRVVDRNNRPINNVLQSDFQIYEDGVPQTIEFFSHSEVPTNYSLVIDNSGSLRFQIEKVIEAGKILVQTNRPDDQTSIIRFVSRDKISIEQDFTDNKEDINYALDNMFIEGGQTAIIDAVYLAATAVNDHEKSLGRGDRTRRALVVVTDGEDRDSYYSEEQLFELLRETDVQIYTIGFVGELSRERGFISKSPQGKAKSFLERMASETGGKSYFPANTSELINIANDIGKELRTQYSIGYIPTNDRNDGTYRNIRVEIKDGPNKQKRIPVTRSGRVANDPNAAPATVQPEGSK